MTSTVLALRKEMADLHRRKPAPDTSPVPDRGNDRLVDC
jgi:hypothetical protein